MFDFGINSVDLLLCLCVFYMSVCLNERLEWVCEWVSEPVFVQFINVCKKISHSKTDFRKGPKQFKSKVENCILIHTHVYPPHRVALHCSGIASHHCYRSRCIVIRTIVHTHQSFSISDLKVKRDVGGWWMVHAWIFISTASTLIHSPNLHNYSMQSESSNDKNERKKRTKFRLNKGN